MGGSGKGGRGGGSVRSRERGESVRSEEERREGGREGGRVSEVEEKGEGVRKERTIVFIDQILRGADYRTNTMDPQQFTCSSACTVPNIQE